ncbi:MAG: LysR family transcriptional regulator [Opitutae bacterium]|nr:LysR family transcriptional regulator [Opitutae bacterium]
MDHWILPDLIVLLEVVRAGSFTRAAERLHTVQSNVTARIKTLERAAGVPLLQRHARSIKPTPAGEAALALALRLDAVMDDLRFTFGRGAQASMGKLRLGSIETTAASHLPAVVARYARQHPKVEVSVETGSSASLLKQLQAGELDAVFVSRAPGITGFREIVAFRDELAIVAPATLGSTAELLASADTPVSVLVQRLGCSYTDRLLGYLKQKSKRSCRLRELGTLEGVLGFVEVGAGVAAMPRTFARTAAGRRRLKLFPLPKKFAELKTYLVAPASRDSSFATNEFISCCERPASGVSAA